MSTSGEYIRSTRPPPQHFVITLPKNGLKSPDFLFQCHERVKLIGGQIIHADGNAHPNRRPDIHRRLQQPAIGRGIDCPLQLRKRTFGAAREDSLFRLGSFGKVWALFARAESFAAERPVSEIPQGGTLGPLPR